MNKCGDVGLSHDHPFASAVKYTLPAMALHWVVAALLLVGFGMGQYMTELAFSPQKLRLYSWHKWVGITVLGLVLLRVVWRLTHRPPPLPEQTPLWQRHAAALSHAALYLLMVCIPLSGWAYSSASGIPTVLYGWWALPDWMPRDATWAERLQWIHVTLNGVLAALVAVHLAAAIKHQWWDRDGLLNRMWPGRSGPGVKL